MGEFGRWWAARNQVEIDVACDSTTLQVTMTLPQRVAGLAIEVPDGWKLALSESSPNGIEQRGTVVAFPELQGTQTVQLTPSSMSTAPRGPSPARRRS